MSSLAILGAGAWGTALAIKLSSRFDVRLWARDATQAAAIKAARRNERYLPGFLLPDSIVAVRRVLSREQLQLLLDRCCPNSKATE